MTVKNIRTIVKNRYRLSTKVQMNFELSFPISLIGKCCITINNADDIRTQKISPSLKGIVFSDTIPLRWFTSSILIPWEKMLKIAIFDTPHMLLSSKQDKQTFGFGYCTLRLDDPQEITIELPWSKKFTDYVHKNQLIDI